MRLKYKHAAILIALILALCAILTGCDGGEETTAPEVIETVPETVPETEAPALSEYTILSGKEGLFKIVRPEELDSSDVAVSAAVEIRKFINDRTGVSLKLGDDWIAAGAEHNAEAFEILVGATSYPESAEVMTSIG